MKIIVLLSIMLLSVERIFAQLNTNGQPSPMVSISIGVHQVFVNNNAFQSWALRNYNKNIPSHASFESDFNLMAKGYDLGIHLSVPSPYGITSGYFGKRLTNPYAPVSSWLNFEIGSLWSDHKDLAPVNYHQTPDQVGQKLELDYMTSFIGLTSKNYFNRLHFKIGRRGPSINTGFYLSLDYAVFNNGAWKYGYNYNDGSSDPDDSGSGFKGVKVTDVPRLNNFFMDAGIFFMIGN